MLHVDSVDLFHGAAQALRKVSLRAELGRITCVLGRNGVDKSSLLRAIAGLRPIRGGTIALAAEDVSRLRIHARAKRGIDDLRSRGDVAIVRVEQCFESASDLADSFAVMDRGAVVMAGAKADRIEREVRAHLGV